MRMSASGSGGSGFTVHRVLRVVCWALIALAAAYAAIVIYAYPHDHEGHISAAVVAKIQAQKLTEKDVNGSDLPPLPDPSQVNATIAGVDANQNGIRDDVELAIFAEYPTSSATSTTIRAAELQYAMDEQIMLVDVFDTSTWKAAILQQDRGFDCLYDSSSSSYEALVKEVENLALNTPARKKQADLVEQYAVAYELPSDPDCDVTRG